MKSIGFFKDFRNFIARGNVVDLAVGVIIGAAFGKIVDSLVKDIVMPVINPLIPGGDWRELKIGQNVKIGSFLGNLLDFLIIALVVFLMVRVIHKFRHKEEEKGAAPTKQEELLTEIRDLLKENRK